MNLTEKRIKANAYSRGYAAGMKRAWPDWNPPHPPHEQVAALFRAADDLRQAAFGLLAVCIADDGPDGPFVTLEREANDVDKAFSEIGRWLRALPVPELDSKEKP